jgi:RNA polymerase sigma-70 factor (ECF subfamily)
MDPDIRLVRFAKSGNKAAFGRLVRKYRDPVLTLAFDYLHDYELARDIAQDVFIKAFRHLNEFEEKSLFATWLYRITVNSALDARKKQRKLKPARQTILRMQVERTTEEPPQPFLNLDDKLLRALQRLSGNQFTAVVLRYFNEKSIREIAEVLTCSEQTVRIHLHRAMQKLKTDLRRGKLDG